MAVNAVAAATWVPSYTSVDHIFDLDEALTMPLISFPARFTAEVELPAATESDVKNVICSICTEGFNNGGDGGKRIPCGHVYHSNCISTWLSRCNSCPLCRAQVLFN